MNRLTALLLLVIYASLPLARAGEGMWLPIFLSQLNEKEMKAMGMKITAEDIYSINKTSLKDAIVSFGGFCTAEVISGQGLILTNHHCGFDAIQNHTTLQNNYLRDGFWAMQREDEKPNPGLSATFIVRIEDVTKDALNGVNDNMTDKDRQSAIDKNLAAIRKNVVKEAWQDILIRSMFDGNQYFLFVTETYKDVRLVGAPPSAIGKFGSDTDNWVWPRHTGDFSIFRIYANKENKPAEYSKDNVPYQPRHVLPVSLDGVEEGDFTMVFGFPGRTQEYLPAAAVAQIVGKLNPAKIAIRDRALKIMDEAMRADEKTKIQYASKYASTANAWKKWIGETQGINKTNALQRKQEYEADFTRRINENADLKKKYGALLGELGTAYANIEPYVFARDYFTQVYSNSEVLNLCLQLDQFLKAAGKDKDKELEERRTKLKKNLEEFFKEYNPTVDKKVFTALMDMYLKNMHDDYKYDTYALTFLMKNDNQITKAADKLFEKSAIPYKDKLLELLSQPYEKLADNLEKDPLFQFATSLADAYYEVADPKLKEIQAAINRLQRQYMKAQMEVFVEKRFYPDANSTLRVTYGQVQPYFPKDGVKYTHYTFLDGVMEKYIPGDYEFDVPKKLIELYEKRDFGMYEDKSGKMPVCFIGSNHTTGGNSGSPAIDAHGNLIGLNFDRVWEGTMSDLNYDASICRNIMVDVRYILFIMDKFAGAGHLVQELKLVHPKRDAK